MANGINRDPVIQFLKPAGPVLPTGRRPLASHAWETGVAGLFSSNLAIMTTAAAIIESVVAVLAGAALYKEEGGARRNPSRHAYACGKTRIE